MATGTRAPRTIVTINLQGQTDFSIPFEYLARKFVVVTLLGVDRKVLALNTDYRFVGKTVISLVNPTPAGYTQLELRRETSATERLVDFHDGSILRAYDLNLSQIQTLHVAEEARDLTADTIGVNDEGNLDARGRKIVNLAYAENGGDAVPLGQVKQWDDSALYSAIRAKESEDASKASEINSSRSEENADISKNRAALAETNSKASEVSAKADALIASEAARKAEATAAPSIEVFDRLTTVEVVSNKASADVLEIEQAVGLPTRLVASDVLRPVPPWTLYDEDTTVVETAHGVVIQLLSNALPAASPSQNVVFTVNDGWLFKGYATALVSSDGYSRIPCTLSDASPAAPSSIKMDTPEVPQFAWVITTLTLSKQVI